MADKSKSHAQAQSLAVNLLNSHPELPRSRAEVSLIDWLIDELEQGNTEPVRTIFRGVEELLHNAGSEARRQGFDFLQTLQEAVSLMPCGVEAFVQFFGPETSRLWAELNAIWRTSIKLDVLDRSVLEAEVLAYRISQQMLH